MCVWCVCLNFPTCDVRRYVHISAPFIFLLLLLLLLLLFLLFEVFVAILIALIAILISLIALVLAAVLGDGHILLRRNRRRQRLLPATQGGQKHSPYATRWCAFTS